MAPTLASPQFALNDYGSTPFATNSSFARGSGGALSQLDAGTPLQLEDATMRAQFNKTGSSSYHLRLHPNVLPRSRSSFRATRERSSRAAAASSSPASTSSWWATQIQNLDTSLGYVDPTHLPLYLTDNILLHIGLDPTNCCIIGFHGAGPVPSGNENANGPGHGNGNQPIQTFAWASWVTPGIYARPNGGINWALQDIHAISHEIAEWADDPFVNNMVEPWLTPTAPQYGCTDVLETGDPVVAIGFAMGTNTFDQGPNPNGTRAPMATTTRGRGSPAVVHADRAEHRFGADPEPIAQHRALHLDGRPEPIPGLPPAGNGLLTHKKFDESEGGPGNEGPSRSVRCRSAPSLP